MLLATIGLGLGLSGGYFGAAGTRTTAHAHQDEALRLPTGTRLKIGLVGMAQPRSDTRDYTADGLHIGLGEEIGRLLGAEVELLPLPPAEAPVALGNGAVDVLLMRGQAPSLPDRATVLDTGYVSGLNVLMRTDTELRHWRQFEGRTLCVTQANAAAQALARSLGAHVLAFEAPAQALAAMRTGQCDGSVHDAVLLESLRTKAEWKKFSATLEARPALPLRIALMPNQAALGTALRMATERIDRSSNWRERSEKWAANVAFEVYFEQIGPDCH